MEKITSLIGVPFPSATTEIEPPLTEAELKPEKEPWSTKAAEESSELADKAELEAAQAEVEAKQKLNLFNTDGTAEEKVAADRAAEEAKEMELRSKVASEIAAEQAQWATEQGELRFANRLIEADPKLYQTDENTTIPR